MRQNRKPFYLLKWIFSASTIIKQINSFKFELYSFLRRITIKHVCTSSGWRIWWWIILTVDYPRFFISAEYILVTIKCWKRIRTFLSFFLYNWCLYILKIRLFFSITNNIHRHEIQRNLSKSNLKGTNFCVCNWQVFGLYRLH